MRKEQRLLKNTDFKKLIDARCSQANQSYIVYYQKNQKNKMRVGLSVSKKHGNAVARNYVKRQVRAICQQSLDFQQSYDLLVIVRPRFQEFDFASNLEQFQKLIRKIFKE